VKITFWLLPCLDLFAGTCDDPQKHSHDSTIEKERQEDRANDYQG
jgi:hypothetical protein